MAYILQITGTSGTGKSTLIPKLAEQLIERGYQVEKILEPAPLRAFTKRYRLKQDKNPWEETALFSADRLMTYDESVIPRMHESNLIFLAERGLIDTLVYQGLQGGVDLEVIKKQNARIPYPNVSLCLVVDGKEGNRRAHERFSQGGDPVTLTESPENIDKLAGYYRQAKKQFPEFNIQIIDTTNQNNDQTKEACFEAIKNVIRT